MTSNFVVRQVYKVGGNNFVPQVTSRRSQFKRAINTRVFERQWGYTFLKEFRVIRVKRSVQCTFLRHKRYSLMGKTSLATKHRVNSCPVGHTLVYQKLLKLSKIPPEHIKCFFFWWKYRQLPLSKKKQVLKYSKFILKKSIYVPQVTHGNGHIYIYIYRYIVLKII